MIVKQKSKVIPIEKSSTHYKMYKGGKLWLTAGITTLSMAGMMIATGELQTAHADTTTTANNTQQTATGGNAKRLLQVEHLDKLAQLLSR